MFQIYKPYIANNIDLFTPFGLSVFANGIDQNKTIDLIYDSLKNEFDSEQTKFYALPREVEDGKGPITEINPTLRITEYMASILFNDNVSINIEEEDQEKLNKSLERNRFNQKFMGYKQL